MISPNAETIEGAKDSIGSVPDFIRSSQRKELHEAVGDQSDDFVSGYELGLAVARRMVAGSTAIILSKVNPDEVL
jgi:hypothetical protein